ncbi:hypothetical protein [Tunturiibacter gelidoferens]|uniref:Uncharacterized protein n=1 Tax=Tunturiibacter gelidiferens TaxID=3069689 RepID=A0ACC5P209_9BACT|nr:hypothetical protein [Edaphobacter lichenicola]MBB5340894.1 hypothetical protein [Edaphobacter lichenicola]
MSVFGSSCKFCFQIAGLAVLCASLNGCVDLDDAAGLSKLSDEARVALPKVSNDVAATCARQNTLFENTPAAERPKAEQAQDCKPYQELADHLAKDQNVLIAYFDALGKLSSNKPMGYDATIDQNVTTSSINTTFSASAIAAGNDAQNILKSLADAATSGYREKQLGQLISANDAAVQSLTQSLKKVITADYAVLLANEELSLDTFYQGPMASAQPNERLALILVQRQYAHDKTALQSRKDGIVSYGKAMDDLAALHTKLRQEAGKRANMVEVSKQIGPIVESLKTALSDIQSRSNQP